jgi:hypothetical protein
MVLANHNEVEHVWSGPKTTSLKELFLYEIKITDYNFPTDEQLAHIMKYYLDFIILN